MQPADVLKASVKVCMFDQYGTVVDMQSGLTEAATPFLQEKGWTGKPRLVRHVVAPDAFREFDDRRAAACASTRPIARSAIGRVAHVLERAGIEHTLDEVRSSGGADREAAAVPGGAGRARAAANDAIGSSCCRTAIRTCSRRPSRITASPFDDVISVAAAERLQAACGDLHQGGRDRGRANGRGAVRRQPRVRLHRREVGRHAHRVHRPPAAARSA